MHSSRAPTREPDRAELERAVLRLESEGDLQGLIRLVEAWERDGTPELLALRAEARAFLALRLMDRAWVRLRQASQLAPEDPEVMALTAEVFVARGWPARARKVLDQLREGEPEHAALARLDAAAAAPPAAPPADARDVERRGDPRELMQLAEVYLCTGSFLRAKSILERVRRAEPMNHRAELLLWGLQGEYLPRGRSLADLVSDALPSTEWEGVENTESVQRADLGAMDPPTAEVTRSTLIEAGLLEPGAPESFPSLFRRVGDEGLPSEREEGEVTVASGIASRSQMQELPVGEHTDPGMRVQDEGGDTRIMQVIPGPGGGLSSEIDGPIHRPSEGPELLKQTLDLRAWQQSMGMSGAQPEDAGAEEDEDFLEAEDEDLVVMTRREGAASDSEPAVPRSGPIEVVEKHPIPQGTVPPAASADDGDGAHPPTEEEEAQAVADLVDASRPERRWGRVGLAVVVMAAVMAAATGGTIHYLHGVVAGGQLDEARRGLAAGDYRGLLELEARLDATVRAGAAPLEARSLALAMVDSVLWGEYTGNPDQHLQAEQALRVALDHGAPIQALALAEGQLALLEGDVDGAARHSAAAGHADESSAWLAGRVALAQGQPHAGLEVWDEAWASKAQGIRHRLLHEALLRAAGQREEADTEAQTLLASAGDNPLVRLAAATEGWGATDAAGRLAGVDAALAQGGSDLAPRQLAELHIARARLLASTEQADAALDALQRAASLDSTNPVALYALGAAALGSGKITDGLDDFESCVRFNTWSLPCRRGQVQALLDLDRVDEARAAAGDWPGEGSRVSSLSAWADLQGEQVDAAKAVLVSQVEAEGGDGDGLSLYLLGLALSRDPADAERADRALARATAALVGTGDPLDAILAGRAAAARARIAAAPDLDARTREALLLGDGDPTVHVLLAQRLEEAGRHAAALQQVERATALGPQSAEAWYGRGQLFFAPSSMAEATRSWRRYLDLKPSGGRADRVSSRLR